MGLDVHEELLSMFLQHTEADEVAAALGVRPAKGQHVSEVGFRSPSHRIMRRLRADHKRKPDTGGEIIGRSLELPTAHYGRPTLTLAKGPSKPVVVDFCVSHPVSIALKKKSPR